jgi:hypothetical protein
MLLFKLLQVAFLKTLGRRGISFYIKVATSVIIKAHTTKTLMEKLI